MTKTKECRGKKFVPFSSWRAPDFFLEGPVLLIDLPKNQLSQNLPLGVLFIPIYHYCLSVGLKIQTGKDICLSLVLLFKSIDTIFFKSLY